MQRPGLWIRATLTLLLFAVVVWWLAIVAGRLGDGPVTDAKGNVVLDEFARTKDVLLVVLPLLTTALGYWFGAAGKDKADADAAKAQSDANNVHKKLQGVLDSSTDTGLLDRAREKFPEAF